MIHNTQSAQILRKQDERNIHAIMKTYIYICNRTSCAEVHELLQSHCGDNWEGTVFMIACIYIYIYFNIFIHCIKQLTDLACVFPNACS